MTSVSDTLLDRLKAVECPDATSPTRDPALVFDRALGSRVWDCDGREYIDLCAGFGVLALGHNAPETAEVLARHVPGGDAAGAPPPVMHAMGDVYASRAKVELLEYLTSIMPAPLEMAALALTGGQAVELAVKTAMLATGRHGFVVFDGGYHGLDLGVLPLTAKGDFRAPFARWLAPGSVERLTYGCPRADVDAALRRLDERGFGAAAVLTEPVQGRAGVRPAATEWLASLREACDAAGALLIYDEVFTGLGRTGRLTYSAEVPADLICLGKALGGGLPLSACVGTRRAMEAWPASTGEALHTGTFFGHPLSCATALATLRRIVASDLPGRARTVGDEARCRLRRELAEMPAVAEVRGEGLMLGVELRRAGLGVRLMDRLRADGVIALVSGESGQSLSITPALTIPNDLMHEALERLRVAIAEL